MQAVLIILHLMEATGGCKPQINSFLDLQRFFQFVDHLILTCFFLNRESQYSINKRNHAVNFAIRLTIVQNLVST